jgi:hypothetical protein
MRLGRGYPASLVAFLHRFGQTASGSFSLGWTGLYQVQAFEARPELPVLRALTLLATPRSIVSDFKHFNQIQQRRLFLLKDKVAKSIVRPSQQLAVLLSFFILHNASAD